MKKKNFDEEKIMKKENILKKKILSRRKNFN